MLNGLLIALIAVAALACPAMMWLGRRGIGPGCAMMGCSPKQKPETINDLRTRHEELVKRIAQLEAREPSEQPVGAQPAQAASPNAIR